MSKQLFEHLTDLRLLSEKVVAPFCTRRATPLFPHEQSKRAVYWCRDKRTSAVCYLCARCATAVRVEREAAEAGHAPASSIQLAALVAVFTAERGLEPPTRINPVEAATRRALLLWEERRLIVRARRAHASGRVFSRFVWRDACPECLLRAPQHAEDCRVVGQAAVRRSCT